MSEVIADSVIGTGFVFLICNKMKLGIEQVRNGGLPPLALPICNTRDEIGKASKPPFLTCSVYSSGEKELTRWITY
jgi:hypothetical protein